MLKKKIMTNNEMDEMIKATDELASHLVANANKFAEALYYEEFETCEAITKEKNKYITLYLQVMSLYSDVDDYQAVVTLNETYDLIVEKVTERLK